MRTMNRRTVLKLAATGLALGAPRIAHAAPAWNRKLVLVELQGGNDGLNTVVPFNDDTYKKLRPTLALGADGVIKIGDGVGLHPSMKPLLPAWNAREMAIVQGIGDRKSTRLNSSH